MTNTIKGNKKVEVTADTLQHIKMNYMESLKNMEFPKANSQETESEEFITLFHGTTTGPEASQLNSILKSGILPRKDTNIDNWEHVTSSTENITYLTNKWHYFYACHANMNVLLNTYGEDWLKHSVESGIYPCYIECKIPKRLLVMDEDFIFSDYMRKAIKRSLKQEKDLVFDPIECLNHYGTVGVMGAIPPEYIVSFTILAEPGMYSYVLDEKSQYHRDYIKWQKGKGKGALRIKDLMEREACSSYNGTWWRKQIPLGKEIGRIGINERTNNISILFKR